MKTVTFLIQPPSGPLRRKVLTVATKREGLPLYTAARLLRTGEWDLSARSYAWTKEEAEAHVVEQKSLDAEGSLLFGTSIFEYAVLPLVPERSSRTDLCVAACEGVPDDQLTPGLLARLPGGDPS